MTGYADKIEMYCMGMTRMHFFPCFTEDEETYETIIMDWVVWILWKGS
jgi:hypothetical protein